jgi:hypothetical protein
MVMEKDQGFCRYFALEVLSRALPIGGQGGNHEGKHLTLNLLQLRRLYLVPRETAHVLSTLLIRGNRMERRRDKDRCKDPASAGPNCRRLADGYRVIGKFEFTSTTSTNITSSSLSLLYFIGADG